LNTGFNQLNQVKQFAILPFHVEFLGSLQLKRMDLGETLVKP
jgi:hypothetical protein